MSESVQAIDRQKCLLKIWMAFPDVDLVMNMMMNQLVAVTT